MALTLFFRTILLTVRVDLCSCILIPEKEIVPGLEAQVEACADPDRKQNRLHTSQAANYVSYRFQFELGSGMYATMLLREVMKTTTSLAADEE